jgi:hypothetical protein
MLSFGKRSPLRDSLAEGRVKMAQDWYVPQAMPVVAPVANAPMRELRPLSLGEILDRIFSIYRSRFWLFSGIAAIHAATALVLQLLTLLVQHRVAGRYGVIVGSRVATGVSVIAGLLLILPYVITQAATVYALGEVYLGKGTTAADAVRATFGRWYRYVGIAFLIGLYSLWLPIVLVTPAIVILAAMKSAGLMWLAGLLLFAGICSMAYTVWMVLRYSLSVQPAVIEGAAIRESLRRSRTLTKGAKGRIFVVILIVSALAMTAGMLQMPMLFIVMRSPLQEHILAQAVSLVINAFVQMVVTPVGLIGLSLVYFDQRVRQEGLDLLMMLGGAVASGPAQTSVQPSGNGSV